MKSKRSKGLLAGLPLSGDDAARLVLEAAEESLARRATAERRPTTLRDLRHFVRRLLRREAGFSRLSWVPDVLRHTFASYHALTHRNLPALQLQLGHRDARLLLTRYLNLRPLRRADSQSFWKLASL